MEDTSYKCLHALPDVSPLKRLPRHAGNNVQIGYYNNQFDWSETSDEMTFCGVLPYWYNCFRTVLLQLHAF